MLYTEVWPNFYPNTIDYRFWPNFHPNTIDYGFWPNFHPNTVHSGEVHSSMSNWKSFFFVIKY